MELPKFNFIRDEPQDKNNESYFNFYHENVAPALSEILKADSTPHTIGIFGSWGTGKSTVINLLKKDEDLKMPVFLFDAWKYQDDSLRRIFLIKFKEFLEDELKVKFDKNYLFDFYNFTQKSGVKKAATTKNVSKWTKFVGLAKNNIFITTLVASLIVVGIITLFWSNSQIYQTALSILVFLSSISVVGIVVKPIFEKVMEKVAAALLQTSASSESATTYITGREKLNSPEEFEDRFKDMLSKIGKQKLVIVFDNIDRVQGDTAIAMISTIKTFMEPNSESKVVFLIPCDPDAIDEQIKQFYSRKDNSVGSYSSSDYLRKVFNLILWLPNYVTTDLEEYTKKCLEETDEISKHTNNPEVILVINSAFSRNPRDIIQFVNNLTALIITAYNTKVSERVLGNVAYLAKVQVIKQKFPDGFKRLQKNWNEPEDIYLEGSEDQNEIELKEFMRITSRITTDDAEPFIYFKDPLDTRGLKDSNTLLEALTTGNAEVLQTQITDENNNEAVSKFVLDVLTKYRSLPEALVKIYNSQFNGVIGIVPDDLKDHYFNSLYSLVDTQLWKYNDKIDLELTLKNLKEPTINSDLKKALAVRYIEATKLASGENPDIELIVKIISSIAHNEELFTESQISQVRVAIDSNGQLFEKVSSLFTTKDQQKKYISEKSFFTHFDSLSSSNVLNRMQILESYKDYVNEESYIPDVMSKFTTSLEATYNSGPTEAVTIIPYTDAVKYIFKNFRQEIKEAAYQDYLNRIFNIFNSSYTSYAAEDQKPKLLIGLYWLHGSVTAYDDNIINTLNSFMSNYSFEVIRPFFDYWNQETKNTIFRISFEYLKPKMVSDVNLLNYVYEFSDSQSEQKIMSYLAAQSLGGQAKDFYLSHIADDKLDSIFEGMLEKARSRTLIDDYDLDILAKNIRLNSSRKAKDLAIEIIEHLIDNFSENNVNAVSRILGESSFLTNDDKKRVARKLIEAFQNTSNSLNDSYVSLVKYVISNLTSTAEKSAVVGSVMDLVTRATSVELINSLFDELKGLKVRYNVYNENIHTLFGNISNMGDSDLKFTMLRRLPDLGSSRKTKAENEFWSSVPNPQEGDS